MAFSGNPVLQLRVLGELGLFRGDTPVELPPSKKTRALLSYLAVTQRPHRRERLCALLWDVTDDPRGALRWSLSKLRGLVDEGDTRRIVADRDLVSVEPRGLVVDWCWIRERVAAGLAEVPLEELAALADQFRGELLEGLELSDFHDFQAWCIAEREAARQAHATILGALVGRLGEESDEALPRLRTLVRIDPHDPEVRASLVRQLARRGLRAELELHLGAAQELFRELGRPEWTERVRAAARTTSPPPSSPTTHSSSNAAETPEEAAPPSAFALPLAGRRREWERLTEGLERVTRERRALVLVVLGEPGMGKTRLLGELRREALGRPTCLLEGRSYEAELARPYGPWMDALRRLPGHALGPALTRELGPLLSDRGAEDSTTSRDRLFGAVADLVAARAHGETVLVVLDDLHWCDEASAELLHYVVRMNLHRPVLFVLAARGGELPDNDAVERVLRGLRRGSGLEELELEPLDEEATAELLRAAGSVAPVAEVHAKSAGNPLYALELARAAHLPPGAELPRTLRELVRDRVSRLPSGAGEVLRWCAVLGISVEVDWLRRLLGPDAESLLSAIEVLERHGMLQSSRQARGPGGAYEFTHEVVRQAVYADISEPRRQHLHLRVAEMLAEHEGQEEVVLDLVHHAALAGVPARAAEACVRAGRRCLRLFANREAAILARRGLRLAGSLPPQERVQRTVELRQIELTARRPADLTTAARELEDLAEEALDRDCLEHARLAYHLASYLRWERGDWKDAQRSMMQAERVSRGTSEDERILALAEAARCLTLLERDLPHAEALLLEAGGRAARANVALPAIPDAMGLLRWHQGRLDEAVHQFDEARALARQRGDRDGEFRALEHRLLVELEQGALDEAVASARELVHLGERLREGSELPFAQALAAIARHGLGDDQAPAEAERALEALRGADAKHRLIHALTNAAAIELTCRRYRAALSHAEEALAVAERLGRPSEVALACVQAAQAAAALGEHGSAEGYRRRASGLPRLGLSSRAQHALMVVSSPDDPRSSAPGLAAEQGEPHVE